MHARAKPSPAGVSDTTRVGVTCPSAPTRKRTRATPVTPRDRAPAASMQAVVDRAEREAILRALQSSAGNKSVAARELGLSRTTLYRRMEKHGIPL